MVRRTLVVSVAIAALATAMPYSFILDMGTTEGGFIDAPPIAPPPNTTTEAHASANATQTTASALSMLTPVPTSYSNTTSTTYNSTASTTCLPTTTVTIALPNPTPRPGPGAERGEGEPSNTDSEGEPPQKHNQGDPFDTDVATAVSRWPHWFTAATFTLIFYDIITLGLFVWMWVFGYLWWFRRRGNGTRRDGWRRRGAVSEGMETAPTVDRWGRYERTSEWVRHGRYGRTRSLSWERVRSAREVELESEMRRLGMI